MRRSSPILAAVLTVASALPALAQDAGSVGTIVIAHGADAAWNAPVVEVANRAETGGPVEVSFLMGDQVADYRFQDAVARLVEEGATRIVVVPLLASSHSGHYDQIRYLAGDLEELDEVMHHHLMMSGITRASVNVPIEVTEALDASPEIATIIAERALALGTEPAEQALFIVGHGPNSAEEYAEWMANLRPIAETVAASTGFRDVKIGLLRDDAPEAVRAEAVLGIREVIGLQNAVTRRDVVVVPLLIAKGYISMAKLPGDLQGLSIAYDGEGLLPHAALADWIARKVQEADSQQ